MIVAAMSLPTRLGSTEPGCRSDRAERPYRSHPRPDARPPVRHFPALAGILLTGGYEIPDSIRRLSEGVQQDLPIALTDLGTFTTAERLMRVRGPITKESSRKIETAHRVVRRTGRSGGAAVPRLMFPAPRSVRR